jgi:hypothetical protein
MTATFATIILISTATIGGASNLTTFASFHHTITLSRSEMARIADCRDNILAAARHAVATKDFIPLQARVIACLDHVPPLNFSREIAIRLLDVLEGVPFEHAFTVGD